MNGVGKREAFRERGEGEGIERERERQEAPLALGPIAVAIPRHQHPNRHIVASNHVGLWGRVQ